MKKEVSQGKLRQMFVCEMWIGRNTCMKQYHACRKNTRNSVLFRFGFFIFSATFFFVRVIIHYTTDMRPEYLRINTQTA